MDTNAQLERAAHQITAVLLLRFQQDLDTLTCYPISVQDRHLAQIEGALKHYLLIDCGWRGDAAVDMATTYVRALKFKLQKPKRNEVIQ